MVLPSMRVMEATEQTSLIALDVLYPEVCKLCDLKIISHQASIICKELIICLISNEQGMKREEATKYISGKRYALIVICVCVMK